MFRYIFRLPWLLLCVGRSFVRWVLIGGDYGPRIQTLERHIARIDMRHSRMVSAGPGQRSDPGAPARSRFPVEAFPYLKTFPNPWTGDGDSQPVGEQTEPKVTDAA